MKGFEPVELKQAGLLSRLIGRKPKENAVREIHNLLAALPISELTAADIERVLSDYELPREHAQEGLRDLYRVGLDSRVKDLELSEEDVADLSRLRYVLGLGDEAAKEIEIDRLREGYRWALRNALQDGALSNDEKAKLEAMAVNFNLPTDIRETIYKEEVLAVIQ